MSDRPHIYYGLCEGGPFHQKHLADAKAVFPVAYDKVTKKYEGPVQAPAKYGNPSLRFGEYVFDGKTWVWQDARRPA